MKSSALQSLQVGERRQIHGRSGNKSCLRRFRLPSQHSTDWVAEMVDISFSQFWRPGRPGPRLWPVWFLLRALFLTYKQYPSCCVVTWPERGHKLSGISCDKGTNHFRGPHPHDPCCPQSPPKGSIYTYHHTGDYYFSYVFWRNTFRP